MLEYFDCNHPLFRAECLSGNRVDLTKLKPYLKLPDGVIIYTIKIRVDSPAKIYLKYKNRIEECYMCIKDYNIIDDFPIVAINFTEYV